MTDLIKSVAELTYLRDREGLEITLASVMFDLIGATRLMMWRLAGHPDGHRVRLRAGLEADNRMAFSAMPTDIHDLPSLDSRAEFRACYDSKAPLRLQLEEDGDHCHIFPVTSERELIGLLEIHHPTPLKEEQERLVTGMLRIYRNHLAVLDYSERDELTGLLNRKTFEGYFTRRVTAEPSRPVNIAGFEWIGTRRPPNDGQRPWLAVIDIDFFKRVNDQFGHLYGDEVLLLLARLMRSSFREADLLFRFGGEEFVVLLGHTEAVHAGEVFERFRATVEAFRFPQIERVTISIGYTCAGTGDTGANAFQRADEALYIAKERGRNQVWSYEKLLMDGTVQPKQAPPGDIELF